MAGTKESAQARQRKEERRQAFYRSMTERAQKERTIKGTEQAGCGVGPAKKAKGNGVQDASVCKPTTHAATASTTATYDALSVTPTSILTCDPRGYATAATIAALPPRAVDQQQGSFQANHCTGTLDQSVFELQRRVLLAQEQHGAQAASSSLPVSNLYNSSAYLTQCQNLAVVAATAVHLQQQQQDRQRLLMAHRQEFLEQRQHARAVAAATARSQQAVAAASRFADAQREEEENEQEVSTASRANRARSALALLMQQQRRIQDLEQKLALASSSPLSHAPADGVSIAAAGAAVDDLACSKTSKTAVVVDLVDEDDDEDNDGQGTMASSSHSSLSSSRGMQGGVVKHNKQQPVDGGPVPPLSAYALFLKDEWTKIMRHAKDNNRTVNPTVLVQAIATKWKALDQATLVRYSVLASQDKERYQRECTAAQVHHHLQQQQQHVQY